MLYTDGLVEERPASLTDGRLRRVCQLCDAPWQRPQELVDTILAELRPGPAEDDVALLVLCLDGPGI